ncbi:S8 family serine peptidase [Pontibacillus yanchengensis]|uniref:S8 family serine peptidase n=1 Tax=Pontibacillus yanchengensis TaxID=462910 RepID=A0ACC7VL66_9BACI|nr:S8 family serine peptidase [Pontibacillus yanchengensis]MYL55557.1 S8 family serine peptidase [Pontibacillus yanchengensis]
MKAFLALFLVLQSLIAFIILYDFDTEDTIVAILDSGIYKSHPLFEDRILKGYDLVNWDFAPDDELGHGTQVAGIIMDLNSDSNIKLLPIKKLGYPANTPLSILLAIVSGADVVNMSFHQPYNPITEQLLRFGTHKGVLFIASSGNEGKDMLTYPAKYDTVIPVAATDYGNSVLSGNYGEGVTYISPGIDVLSAGLGGNFTTVSGTSMASAYATGVFAYVKDLHPEATNEELIQYVNQYARSIVYTKSDKQIELKTLDIQKFKAIASEQSYLWMSALEWKQHNASTPSIKIDSFNVEKVYIHDNGSFYKTYPGDTDSVMLPAKDGEHEVRIHFHNGERWQDHHLSYEIDTTSPIIETNNQIHASTTNLHIRVTDPNLGYVLINGEKPSYLTGASFSTGNTRDFSLFSNTKPVVIEAYDTFGNSRIEVFYSPEMTTPHKQQ